MGDPQPAVYIKKIKCMLCNKPPHSNMGRIYGMKAPNGMWYIGQTRKSIPKRVSQQKYEAVMGSDHCPLLHSAIREFGIDAFEIVELLTCDDDQLDECESQKIQEYDSVFPNGLNVMSGGHDGAVKRLHVPAQDRSSVPMDMKINELPEGIIKEGDVWVVRHPAGPVKTFDKSSEFENLRRAISFYTYTQKRIEDPTSYRYLKSVEQSKYCVDIPGYRPKYFATADESVSNRARAKEYLVKIMENPEEPDLPGSIRTIKDGFRVKFPEMKDKHFVAEKMSSEEKYKKAQEFLEDLRANGIPEEEFPKVAGLQKYRKGFRVRLPGIAEPIRFENATKTKQELWDAAKAYIDEYNK